MAGSLLDRAVRALEILAHNAGGLPLQHLVDALNVPKSAAHRLMGDLIRLGLARQDPATGHYLLTTRLLSLGFSYLTSSGIVDVAQPILDQLARHSGELVRLAIADGDQLTWVAKAQGARSGLRYDPEMGQHPTLFCTATGQAWLARVDDERALQIVVKQGFGGFDQFGPNAPRTISAFAETLARARRLSYAAVAESAAVGTSAMAAAIMHPRTNAAIGTVSIAGPTFRLTAARIAELAPALLAAASELSQASIASDYFAEASRSSAPARRHA